MRARKRVVTAAGGPSARLKRTPTVRRIKPAILPVDRSRPRASAARPTPTSEGTAVGAVDLQVDLGRGLVLRNPLIGGSGAFGYGVEVADLIDLDRIGAIVTRSTTLRARTGNPGPRMVEVPGGVLTGIGLQNPGIDAVRERYAPTWSGWQTPVIVGLAGESVADVVAMVSRLDGEPGVAGIELNLSCANGSRGGLLFGLDVDAAAGLTAAVRRATDLPLIVKLSLGAADVRAIARAAANAGADAISAINTLPGLALRPNRTGAALGSVYGGLSGPAVRPLALRIVFEVAQAVEIPIIGLGGVGTVDDVLDFLAAGASAVGVATAALAEPGLPGRLASELADRCRELGLGGYGSLVGGALPRRRIPESAKGAGYRP